MYARLVSGNKWLSEMGTYNLYLALITEHIAIVLHVSVWDLSQKPNGA